MALFIEYTPAVQEVPGLIPGFDSRLRHNILKCSMQKEVDGAGQASTLSCLTKLTMKNIVGDNVEFFILLIVYI